MTEYDNTNRGMLFRNDKKASDTHPDHNGTINVEGVEYYLNAWIKQGKSGSRFFSLSVKRKNVVEQRNDSRRGDGSGKDKSPPTEDHNEFEDDIPF